MILILTGNFSDESASMVLENFNARSFEKTPPKKLVPIETDKPAHLVIEEKAGITQTYLNIGARTVCSTHPDAHVLDLISVMLSGGTNSRLFIELREKNALTYDVNSDHNKGVDFGFFNINCAVKDKNLAKAERLILKELTKLRTKKIQLNELERIKESDSRC